MRYVVYGAGAIGATIGARLTEAGREAVLIARGRHYEALSDTGLRYSDPERTRTLAIPVVDRPGAVSWRDDDVVILAMKTQDTAAALTELADAAPQSVSIVCAQNGVENERMALRRFPDVYGVYVVMPTSHLEPGAVDAYALPVVGTLSIGRYPGGTDDTARRISADLEASGFSSPVEDDIMRWKYRKLLGNLSNAIDAVAGWAARETDLGDRARAEAMACFAAAGIGVATEADDVDGRKVVLGMKPVDGGRTHQGSSSWQSLARGAGSIEADYLNGEIVLLGRRYGVPTPVNALLQRQANQLARSGAEPGSVTVEALLAALG